MMGVDVSAGPVRYHLEKQCRICGHRDTATVLEFGNAPIADQLLDEAQLDAEEPHIPLSLAICRECGLVQIPQTVEPGLLFGSGYPYYSSTSTSWLAHCRANARELIERIGLDRRSLVIEVASNDGYLLKNFAEAGIPVLGIDPSGPAAAAQRSGIPTLREFFGEQTAERLRREGRQADLVIANNVLAHVADLHGFVRGLSMILKPQGMLVIEVPYAGDLFGQSAFDTVYHQHLCYFAVAPLNRLLTQHGLAITEVRRLGTHGGSLRLYIRRGSAASEHVRGIMDSERATGLLSAERWRALAGRAQRIREALLQMLEALRREGKTIAAYGAAAKGTTLLHYCGIGPSLVDYVVDLNPRKQGKYLPGCRLRIRSPEVLSRERPDYLLLLAWNLRDEIIPQQAAFLDAGGRMIVPVPFPEVVPKCA